ncbi:MAG TPA: hypothetical protein PLL30_05140 [Candidatus Krumholzibacteria bacterium]|nr:hypothetical protein [Candidatus Krumholzibacteria bacterium]HPD71148.1 hypothetical protein [Candidatus Krumholzibacteria bacterium]HRY39152.1 hypothetical protein [Candidatus Krumholzibacteria bacterium]
MTSRILAAALVGGALIAAGPAAATIFCGGNGVVKLSFTPGPDLQAVKDAPPDSNGVVRVDVWAVLDEVAQVEGPGGVFLALGGFELTLLVEGADEVTLAKTVDIPHRDFGSGPAQCRVGTVPGELIKDGRLVLCHWTVTLAGPASNVRFALDPAGVPTCADLEGCGDAGIYAGYVGTTDASQENYFFGAGYAPAVLNPTVEPDLAAAPCKIGYANVGIYRARAPRE